MSAPVHVNYGKTSVVLVTSHLLKEVDVSIVPGLKNPRTVPKLLQNPGFPMEYCINKKIE